MSWIQIQLDTFAEHVEQLEDVLLASGACAVTLQDSFDVPLYDESEPSSTKPLWEHVLLTGLFSIDIPIDDVLTLLQEQFVSAYTHCKVEAVEDKDWSTVWLKEFKPMVFGKNLWVCPSCIAPPCPEAINVTLDPGLAFGTGTHPTTALCLRWLDDHFSRESSNTVVDFGCGSGILGIAASLLGAEYVVGVDIDPQAIVSSKNNFETNKINKKNYGLFLNSELPSLKADVVLANILLNPLQQLTEQLSSLVAFGGKIVLSGVLENQINELKACYENYFSITNIMVEGGWALLEGSKRS